jgi:hypothetical protein
MSRLLALLTLVVAAVVAPTAGARHEEGRSHCPIVQRQVVSFDSRGTIGKRTNLELRGPAVIMRVRVGGIVFRRCGWRADATVTNTSGRRIWIHPGFTVGIRDTLKPRHGMLPRLDAKFYRPALPRFLRAGETWSGTFGGRGIPRYRTALSVHLGAFVNRHFCQGCLSFGWTSKERVWR